MAYRDISLSSFHQQDPSSLISDQQPVLVAAAGPARQSRATVAFRVILVIPHLVVLYFLGVAAAAVAFIGWFGALFTGRLPDFAGEYLSGYVRWYSRVAAYLLLLTDVYPPFLLKDAAYPVRVAVTPSRLNRLAVLFRLVLAIPAAILSTITLWGLGTIVIFIAWLAALLSGKLPASLHHAFAAVLRYIVRYYGYLYLLTDAYPRGLFGDKPGLPANGGPGYGMPGPGYGGPERAYGGPDRAYGAPGAGYGAPDPAYGPAGGYNAPPGYGGPGYGAQDPAYGPPRGYYAPPGYRTAAPGYGEPAAGYPAARGARHRAATPKAPSQAASWQMVLPTGAKCLVGLVLVLGLVTAVGAGISSRSVISSVARGSEINQLNSAIAANNEAIDQNQKAVAQVNSALAKINSAQTKLNSQMNLVVKETGACSSVGCDDAQAMRAAAHIAAFGRRLRAIAIPQASAAAASKFVPDITGLKQSWITMGRSVSFTDFANRAGQGEKFGRRFDRGYQALVASLDKLGTALSRQAALLNQRSTSLNRQLAALNAG